MMDLLVALPLFLGMEKALATSGSGLLIEDIQLFQQTTNVGLQDEALRAQDDADASGADFFPINGTGSSRNLDEEYGAYVMFDWNDIPYELKDVPRQTWFAPYVRDVADRGIVTGYMDAYGRPSGIFGPERPVSVEEVAKMALAATYIDLSSCGEIAKNPLAEGQWSLRYIACAEKNGFTVFSDGTVDLRRPALRSEVVVTILEAFSVHPKPLVGTGTLFTDILASTPFASAIQQAAIDGIVSGYKDDQGNLTGTFGADKEINRAEVAKILSIALQVYGAN